MDKQENYSKIKGLTDAFRIKSKADQIISIKSDQPLGFILNQNDIIAINKLQKAKGSVAILFGIEADGKLTISALSCDDIGTINEDHYKKALNGQETWDGDTNSRDPKVNANMSFNDFIEYMPPPTVSEVTATTKPQAVNGEVSNDIAIPFTPTKYQKVIEITYNFINLARKISNPTSFKDVPLGIFFSDEDLCRIKGLSTRGQGVIMLYGLEAAATPESITVSFVEADKVDDVLCISNNHKDKTIDKKGEETWTDQKTLIKISNTDVVIKNFIEDKN